MDYEQKKEQEFLEHEAKKKARSMLTRQQMRVLAELRRGDQNTGHFCRLNPPILRASERIRELNEKGFDIRNLKVSKTGLCGPTGMAVYKLVEIMEAV